MHTPGHEHGHVHGHTHGPADRHHGAAHGHGHGHAHGCSADHHTGEYTPAQRADLDLVLAFNHRLAAAIDACLDTVPTVASLDPDPLRYMWVDEGAGQIPAQIARAAAILDEAAPLPGQRRQRAEAIADSHHAARPSVATGAGRTLLTWLEWVDGEGDRLVARLDDGPPTAVLPQLADVFRPVAAIDGAGDAWVFFGRRDGAHVAVWASRHDRDAWSAPEQVSTTDDPSFNQEVVTHADGSLEVVWQGRNDGRFSIYSRRRAADSADASAGEWGPTLLVTEGVEPNVWDPAIAATADGAAYAWAEYVEGRYAIGLRRRRGETWGPVHVLTGGTDYALHPSLAVTGDGRLWCAFDVITVTGHGASGPTRLIARPDTKADPTAAQDGMRAPGDSVPPELLPEVSASLRVVGVEEVPASGGAEEPGVRLHEAPGELAPGLDVVPSALPKLVATADGGLVVGYRVHRQLPLMTYYWEAAAQVLGPQGWGAPITWAGTDATLEEVSLADASLGFGAGDAGVVLATQGDGRLDRALHWTEGFGGRECPYLADHHGSVIWHGVHGAGQVVLDVLASAGAACATDSSTGVPRVVAQGRVESRRWVGSDRPERYRVSTSSGHYTLYWGDLHRHSLVSRCTSGDEPSLEDFYRYAWDVCEYDFWAVTDHAENSTAYQWWSIQKIADLLHVPDRFVPLYGFEWTSAQRGHQNVIYGDVERGAPIFSAFADGTTDPAGLWAGLAQHPQFPAITIPHHPGSAMVHNDWDYYDERFSRLVEVFQACRGNYESDTCFRQYSDGTATGTFMLDGLERGHRFGLIASSDHGHGASYVGVLASSLSRGDVFEGLHARRTFAATTRDVVVDLRLGDHLMGEEVAWPSSARAREFTVHAQAYADIARLDLVRDGRVVHSVRPVAGDSVDGELRVDARLEWGEADVTTDWDGDLSVTGGRLVVPEFVGPEVTSASAERVTWVHRTYSFGEPYGAQRGCVEVSIVGPREARVRARCGGRDVTLTLGEIVDGIASGGLDLDPPGDDAAVPGRLRFQPSIGALESLGVRDLDVAFIDDDALGRSSYTYARLILVDGEMAWSSPIWVTSTG